VKRNQPSHVAFSDECQFNTGRYRGIGLVTFAKQEEDRINREMAVLLAESNAGELKWEKVRNTKYRLAALKTADYAIRLARAGVMRIDVLVWDIWDRRHDIQGRDDLQNLQRMYYHLFKNVLVNRWPSGSTWHLFPDEHTGIDWRNMEDVLDNSGSWVETESNLFTGGKLHLRLRREFSIVEIAPVRSHAAPGVQIADLFAGLAVYSRSSYERFEGTESCRDKRQGCLAFSNEPRVHMSNADVERCRLLAEFNAACKSKRLGVSLKTHWGLRTLNPENPINFWWYEPQHDADRAPTKRS
jgi:hypothetical protein